MADLGATFTDAEIAKTEKELKAVYNKAYKDILQKQKDFNEKYKIKEEKKLKQVASGQMTQEEFDHWKKGQVFQGKQWENKKKQILGTIYKTNDVATGIVNGKTHNVFAFNANYTAYDLEHGAGVNFGFELYDETTVTNLIKNDPQLLPKWKIDQPKDYSWNQKKLNRQVNLGIIEGESLDKIANRLSDTLVTQNFNKMRTFARTAMTGAQNSGRQIRLEEAKKLGINLKKEWMATLDAHTRINHRELDGQKVEMEESFEIKGIKIRYPGDPLAPPAMVYNCRCTMVGDLINYPATYDRYDNIDGKRIKGMTYKEWEEAKKKGNNISPVSLTYEKTKEKIEQINAVVNGKDISATWQRRPDEFAFEIEDVINAQGFDGLPRVVSQEEFDEAVKKSNFVAQRTYSAPDQETLDAYRDQLYHGKWYVDCSTGGAQYGQGMYCAADYNGKITDGIRREMNHYQRLNDNKIGVPASFNERMAYAKKILKSEGLYSEDAVSFVEEYLKNGSVDFDKYPQLSMMQKMDINDVAAYVPTQFAPSYTETLTLDPSAKIIKYKDIADLKQKVSGELRMRSRDIRSNFQTKLNDKITEYVKGLDLSEEGKSAILAETNITQEDPVALFNKLSKAEQDKVMVELDKYGDYGLRQTFDRELHDEMEQLSKNSAEILKMNDGSFAAAQGYDAINAEGHGQSGSYTVILNRTKCIFKGE